MKDKINERFMDNDFQKIFGIFRNHLPLFIITAILLIGGTVLFNKLVVPKYKITSQVMIKSEDQGNNTSRNLSDVLNFGIYGNDQGFNNEILVIKSIPVLQQAIKNLNLNICYYQHKYISYYELYNQSPIKVIPVSDHNQLIDLKYEINFQSDSDFVIKASGTKVTTFNFAKNQLVGLLENVNFEKKGRIGHLIEDVFYSFVIRVDPHKLKLLKTSTFYFEFRNTLDMALDYQSQLTVNPVNEKVTSGIMSFDCLNPEKGVDFINEIGNVYIANNLEKKNHLAKITIEYIDKMLGEVSDSLSNSEQQLQQIKTSSQIMDVGQQSLAINQQMLQLENQLSEGRSKMRYYTYVKEHLANNKSVNDLIIPSSIGINDATLSNSITQLTTLYTERSTFVDNNQINNPQLKIINGKIENIKNTIYANIDYLLKTLEINNSELQSRINKLNGDINKLPVTQRQMLIIERKFKLNDAIYTFLQERRAEASITMASNIPSIEIIEPAIANGMIFPKKNQNLIFALILSLIIPLVLISVHDRLRSSFGSYDEVSKYSSRPLLGKILHTSKKLIKPSSQESSPYLESLRLLRTNLDFFIRDSQRRVILVTSSIENEGKSFTAYNLAMSFALLKKSVVLVTFDLRKPSNYPGLSIENMIGITSYYIGKATMEDIIIHTEVERMDIIPAGKLPPNPAELIELDRTKDIINQLKHRYDYIILDTPPIYYFTDTFLLMKHADINLLVIRHNVTNKNVFSRTIQSIEEKNIPNLALVYNDIPVESNFKYGYKYYQKKQIVKDRV